MKKFSVIVFLLLGFAGYSQSQFLSSKWFNYADSSVNITPSMWIEEAQRFVLVEGPDFLSAPVYKFTKKGDPIEAPELLYNYWVKHSSQTETAYYVHTESEAPLIIQTKKNREGKIYELLLIGILKSSTGYTSLEVRYSK